MKTKDIDMESSAFIALGSNLNLDGVSSLELIKKAIIDLEKSNFKLQAISRFFKNPAFPIGSGPDFVNAVVKVRIDAKPQNILDQLTVSKILFFFVFFYYG